MINKNTQKWLFEEVITVLRKSKAQPLNYKQIAKALDIDNPTDRQKIIEVLTTLHGNGTVEEQDHGKYRLKQEGIYVTGKVDMTSSGSAYIVSDESTDDIFVNNRSLKTALNGDIVKVLLSARRTGKKPEGEVVEVVSRGKSEYTGILQLSKNFGFVTPDNSKMGTDIYIPLGSLNGAKDGEKVIAKIVDYPENAKNPIGEITRVLGKPGDNETEINAIMADYGLPMEFPDEVTREADNIDTRIHESEIANRRDFRKVTTFTIDPVDAKDFDDALSIQKLPNGNWEIGVHIADVAHYLIPGTILDKEAFSRATSVYLVDRTVPMLPEVLSNVACSLRPKEDKYTFSAVFEMDDNATIVNEWFGRTAIHSDRRFSYEEAQEIIETGNGDLADEIKTFDRLAKIMRAERMKKGAIAFDKIEVKFHLDEKGKPIGVHFKVSKDSNKLIEEFMLLANRRVAEFVGRKRQGSKQGAIRPFVYRVHDLPDPEKLANFSTFISKLGYKKIESSSPVGIAKSLNTLLAEVKGKGEENVVEQLAIRTMAKAEYTTNNIGHYGLAFDYYTHFTSPIRRYPDVMVHRLMAQYLAENEGLQKRKGVDQDELEEQCKHSSDMERLASQAERDSIKYKQVEYMVDSVGKVFDGTITGVTEWGIYVEINENKCEGMVRLRDIADDYYVFDEANYCAVGQRKKKVLRLGDHVKIEVKRADLVRKQLDFLLIDDLGRDEAPRDELDFSDAYEPVKKKEFPDAPGKQHNFFDKSRSSGGKGGGKGGSDRGGSGKQGGQSGKPAKNKKPRKR